MSWLHGLRERLSAAFRGNARDRELAEEIQHHLELETDRQIACGAAPAEARRRAMERFGDPRWVATATRQERGTPLFEGQMNDLRWSIRSLVSQPGFTVLALATIALGVASTTAAFTVLDSVLLRPLPYRDADRLVFIQERTATHDLLPPSYPNFVDWRDRAPGFDGVASEMYPQSATVSAGGDPIRVTAAGVSRGFFHVLGVTPTAGREFTPAENTLGGPDVVMVSYEFWKSQMGGRLPLGSLKVGVTPAAIVGVLPSGFRFFESAELYFPHEQEPSTMRSAHNYRVIGRLATGTSLVSARAGMTTLSRALLAAFGTETMAVDAQVTPLRDVMVGDVRLMLAIVFGAAAIVLAIACTNLVSAQLARGLARQREMAVRAAIGASHGQLVRQLFVESGVLVAAGAVAGGLLAMVLVRVLRVVGAGLVPRLEEATVDGRVLCFTVAITAVSIIAVGLYPALRLAKADPGQALNGTRGASTIVHGSVWRLLIGFEIAMAVVLLIGSTLLVRTLHNILTDDPGFETKGLVTASLVPDHVDEQRLEQIRTELASLTEGEGAAFTTQLPFTWGDQAGPVRRPGDPADRDYPAFAGFRVVSWNYFAVLRQPILRGRAFTASDRAGTAGVAIITPGIATALWPGQDPIGKRILTHYLMDQWLTVVGVAAEASSWRMPRGSQNEIFTPLAQHPDKNQGQLVAIVRSSGDPHSVIPLVRARLHALAPGMPAKIQTMDDRISLSAADRRFAMTALTLFGAAALLLAGVGIFGVISYTVATRRHDTGIRMALGATPGRVLRSALMEAVVMAAGGIGVGLVGGLLATRFLRALLYGVTRFDPTAYAIGAGVLLAVALAGACLPAWRSSRVDPLLVIRGE